MTRLTPLLFLVGSLATASSAEPQPPPEATSLLGAPLHRPALIEDAARLEADLRAAQAAPDPASADAIIWVGRRQGYLWRYRDAVATFTAGIARYPDNPRLYRHRGHRYITLRQFPRAEADLERAAALMEGLPPEVEPDGAPNAAGRPRTSLQFNVWYHLGLARYLQADFDGALDAYRRCLAVSTNDDALVATSDWLWMTLRRLGRQADATALLDRITPSMEILENGSYHRRLLMYKGLRSPASLLDAGGDETAVATEGYGVGNYYLVNQDADRAREIFERVVAGSGWNAFGYIAAEADLARMRARR